MPLRKAVQEFVALGPLPDSAGATEADLEGRAALLRGIDPPVAADEAQALVESFGPDECFGLAWSLLHLIETAHSRPTPSGTTLQRSEWLRTIWHSRRSSA